MVQLKSFKYIEPEGGPHSDESGEQQVDEQREEENSRSADGIQAPSSTLSSASSLVQSNSSSQSISTLAGGNLTSDSSQEQETIQEANKPVSGSTTSRLVSEDEATTLSSNEEYQLAQHDIIEEEEEEDSKTANKGDNGSITRINIPTEPPAEVAPRLVGAANVAPGQSPQVLRQAAAGTPLVARHNILVHTRQPSIGGAAVVSGSIQSPLMARTRAAPRARQLDSISQYSFGHRSLQAGNHFEIRWRNINLYARKSKLPRFIAENPIYKLLNGSTGEEEDSKIYYSPPIQHKINLETQGVGRTPSANVKLADLVNNGDERLSLNSMQTADLRPVLTNISGSVFSGQLTAVLGPSGVGKTMLLNSLTGRNTLDGTGSVNLLGASTSKRMSVVTVPQNDVLPGKLSALEDLIFTSKIKNPQRNFDHKRNIERIVRLLQMEKFLSTRIDKLSGGEARRLSIGRELLNSPDIMILDEPTSGLDANTCKRIITALRDIVVHSDTFLDRPMSIIVTIHQPQQEVLNLFHRVYVIAIGGRAIYEGSPTALLPTLLEHSSMSQVCAVEELNDNPAIVALEVASGEYGQGIIGELALHHENQVLEESAFTDGANGSPYQTPRSHRGSPMRSPLSLSSPRLKLLQRAQVNSAAESPLSAHKAFTPLQTPILAKRIPVVGDHVSNITSLSYASTYDVDLPEPTSRLKVAKRLRRSVVMKGDFFSHTWTLMQRCWLLTTRDLFLMGIRILGFLLVAGGIVQIFAHALDPNEHQCPVYESEVDDVIGYIGATKERLNNLQNSLKQGSSTHLFLFHLILCITMVTSALAGLAFPLQMRMFMREFKNGWYSAASFLTSQTLAELPIDAIGPTLAILIVYPTCHQPPSEYYWREAGYIVVMVLASIVCKSQAQIIGALLMDSVENSVFISCVMVAPQALLSGICVRISQMSWPLQIVSYGTFLRYAFESMLVIRYGYNICPCDPNLINGYPLRTSDNAIPPHLERLASGFMALNSNLSETNSEVMTATTTMTDSNNNNLTALTATPSEADNSNLFLKFVQLLTDASNLFVPNAHELGDCSKYRSLYLMDMQVKDKILTIWIPILIFMFIFSRFLTYFVVKIVIKLRRNKRAD